MQHEVIRPVCSICDEAIDSPEFFLNPLTQEKVCEYCLKKNMKWTDDYERYEDDGDI